MLLTKIPMSPLGESFPPTTVNPRGFLPPPFSKTIVIAVRQEDLGRLGRVQKDGDSSLVFLLSIPLLPAGDSRSNEAVLDDDSIKLLTNFLLAELISFRLDVSSNATRKFPVCLFLRLEAVEEPEDPFVADEESGGGMESEVGSSSYEILIIVLFCWES
jgi:hypothetical protein